MKTQRLPPLKRFGQHFLVDKNIVRKIIEAAGVSEGDDILEIGPGRGALTYSLAERARTLVAIEVDRGLAQGLLENFGVASRVHILLCDILKTNLRALAKRFSVVSFKVVANLPFYITTPVIEHLCEFRSCIRDIFITVQKEVAERMTAHPTTKEYGSFTCFVNYFYEPRVLFGIKSASFWPVPRVASSFVRLTPRGPREHALDPGHERLLFQMVRVAFGQRRKMLMKSLSTIMTKKALEGLPDQGLLARRPEELSLDDFILLSRLLFDFSRQRC